MANIPSLSLVKTLEPTDRIYHSRDESLDFQARLLGAWELQQRVMGHSESSIAKSNWNLQAFFKVVDKFIWEITAADIDYYNETLVGRGLTYETRRSYQSSIVTFLDYLRSRYANEIWQRYHVAVPIVYDKFNQYKHRKDDGNEAVAPPPPDVLKRFWAYIKQEISITRRYATVARDYAFYKVLALAGLRINEAVMLDVKDCRFDLGEKGKIHVRFGQGSGGAGPKSRWVPIFGDLEPILHWYFDNIRPLFTDSDQGAIFISEFGTRLSTNSARSSLARRQKALGLTESERFSPHQLRHSFSSNLTEQGVDLLTLKELLGHVSVSTTLNYVTPSADYLEKRVRMTQNHWRNSLND